MAKLETTDGKTTNWCGLWWHPEYNGFSSAPINLAQLKNFKGTVRLYVRKNKFFNNGENGRPNYTFCLKDANAEMFTDIKFADDRDKQSELIAKLAEIMREGNRNADIAGLPSETQARAKRLIEDAIAVIEELTGERWEFSFLTWY